MLRWIKRIAVLTAVLFGISLFAVWLVLSSSLLAKTRGDLAARLLTSKLGQVVEIAGGVRVEIGAVLHVVAEDLALPSQAMANADLAEIGSLEFHVALRDLLSGRINLFDLHASGAKVALLIDKDGTTSWSMKKGDPSTDQEPAASQSGAAPPRSKGNGGNIVDFIAGHEVRFSNSGVIYKDARNGLDLDLLLKSLDLSQKDRSSPVVLQGTGTLNGQELSLSGSFPKKQPFRVSAVSSQVSVEIDGVPEKDGYDAGYSASVAVNIAELGQLLEVLKLEKSLTGSGHVSAVFKKSQGSARIEDLDVLVNLDGGQSLVLKGDLGELGDPTDITLDTIIRLYSEANQPPPATLRRDLKLIGIDMQLIARPGGIPQRRMKIETNGFVLDTSGEGPPPISFSEISRSPGGKLRIGELVLRIGPPDANFLVLEGSVANALKLEGIELEGTLAVPLASLIAPQLFQTSDALGSITGGFRLTGNTEELGLSDLKTVSQGTELWHLNVTGSVKNALKFKDVILDIAADVPSGAELLTALKLEPIDIGPVKLNTKLSSQGTEWTSEADVEVADSELGFSVNLDIDEPHPTVRGQIESDLIRINHLRDIIAASVQLAQLNDLEKAASQKTAPADTAQNEDGKKTEPLVLAKPNETDIGGARDTGNPDTSQQSGPFRNVTLQPLGRAILLSGMDLGVTIDLHKVEGKKGTSSLHSDLEMKNQKARIGPMKFEYGGAHFDIVGSMDLNEDPDTLKLSGSTGGWNFGEIMHELRFKKQASGVLHANFDVAGSHASIQSFLASMSGSATVSMKNGSIDTQLLDLAGLGIIPWLFSKDRGDVATIVCARAPLHFSDGRISTKQAVVETDRVQLVLFGDLDLKHETLDIAGQPRRIGKPLSRSPWPFTAVGPMAKPKIKVKDGPRRLRRSDGASTMPKRRKLCVPDILQLR